MKGHKDANIGDKHAKTLAQQVKEDRHILGALDLELQVRPRLHPAAHLQSMAGNCVQELHAFVTWGLLPRCFLTSACFVWRPMDHALSCFIGEICSMLSVAPGPQAASSQGMFGSCMQIMHACCPLSAAFV